jgi:putative aldouronate transport system substrate-binding protein
MKKRTSFLALLLVLSLLTACGSTGTTTAASAESAASEQSAVETETEAAPEAETQEEPETEEASLEEASVEEPEAVELPEVELPLTTEDVTFKMMLNFPGYLSSFLGTYANHTCFQKAEADTGVNPEFLEISMENMSTQMSLIAASGDYPDLIFDVNQYYAGGTVKALSDDFIMDISDLAEEYAPNYMAVVNSDDSHRKSAYDDDGNMAGVQGYNNSVFTKNGAIIRQDWLDALGLDTPVTVSDWYEVLTAFKDAYGLQDALFMTSAGQDSYHICGAFGSAGVEGMYQKDGTVYSGYNDEGFREYLTTMAKWYKEGLIGSDFLSRSDNLMDSGVEEAAISGKTGIFFSPANVIEEYKASAVSAGDADCQFAPLASPTSDDGETDHFGDYRSYAGDHCVSLSSTCSDPVLAVQFLNYFFTDEGQMLVSYGIEGEAYELDADGNPEYTDLILNNQEGIPMLQFCLVKYTLTDMPSVLVADRNWFTYTDEQVAAQTDIWFNSEDATYTMPPVSLTTEESEDYTSMEQDIETYVEECTVKFIIGDMDIETQWDEYTSKLDAMGIDDCIAIYQAALERFNAR